MSLKIIVQLKTENTLQSNSEMTLIPFILNFMYFHDYFLSGHLPIEISRFTWSIFVRPQVHLMVQIGLD